MSVAEELCYFPLFALNIPDDGRFIPLFGTKDLSGTIAETQTAAAALIFINIDMVMMMHNGLGRAMPNTMGAFHSMMPQI
jgi:hypothetical protein